MKRRKARSSLNRRPPNAQPSTTRKSSTTSPPLTIFTVGHSTRTLREFLHLLQAQHIKRIVDVRSIPRSRHTPQFNEPRLAKALRAIGIAYLHLKKLGGRRHTTKASINLAWRNTSFRGFADYMQTNEFTQGLERLIELAKIRPTAVMCAEAVPWRCHRSLIGDALLIRDIAVEDLFSATNRKPHKLTPFAKVRGLRIAYPAK